MKRGWIDSCWGHGGQKGLDAEFAGRTVRSNQVSCSGTTMGTMAGLRRYLGIMLAEMKVKGCKDYGIDQVIAVHSISLGVGVCRALYMP